MLKVTKFLIENNLDFDLLTQKYGITVNSSNDGRLILNYCQIDSHEHRFNPLVRECRGLILDRQANLVCRSFYRFFNWGEHREDMEKFDFLKSLAYHKEDGSLINVYYWNNEWRISTRNSYAEGEINGKTWSELVRKALSPYFFEYANKEFSYTFELCSVFNKVVRHYPVTTCYLLACFLGEHELDHEIVTHEGLRLGLPLPEVVTFNNIIDAQAYIANKEREDKTFEGVVLRDSNNIRLKVKNPGYLLLHKMINNWNLVNTKNLLPIVLKGEVDEVLAYFPELTSKVDEIQSSLNEVKRELDNYWYCYHDEPSQKKFALAVKDSKYSRILFQARKTGQHPNSILHEFNDYLSERI